MNKKKTKEFMILYNEAIYWNKKVKQFEEVILAFRQEVMRPLINNKDETFKKLCGYFDEKKTT